MECKIKKMNKWQSAKKKKKKVFLINIWKQKTLKCVTFKLKEKKIVPHYSYIFNVISTVASKPGKISETQSSGKYLPRHTFQDNHELIRFNGFNKVKN